MFNKTFIAQPRTQYVPYEKEVTIHEHRAPTDESIKLFDELKEKAIRSVTHSVKLNNNKIDAVSAFVVSNVGLTITDELVIRFILNGENMEFAIKIDRHSFYSSDKYDFQQKILNEMYKQLSNQIAAYVLNTIASDKDSVIFKEILKL